MYLKRNDSGTEIHMNGIEPITYQYPFNDKICYRIYTNGDEEDDNYYLVRTPDLGIKSTRQRKHMLLKKLISWKPIKDSQNGRKVVAKTNKTGIIKETQIKVY